MFAGPDNSESSYLGISLENMLRHRAVEGVLTLDPQGKLSAITPEAECILGLTGTAKSFSLNQLPAPVRAVIQEVQSSGFPVTGRDIMLPRQAGPPETFSITVVPCASGSQGIIVVLRSGSMSADLEHNLRRLDRLAGIGTLSATMAHEIKNALVAVRTFVDLLLEKNPDADLAGVVRREIGRIDSIVSQMLRFAAPAQPRFAPVRLHELLDHSLRLVQHGAANKLIHYQREFQAAPDLFIGDDHQLEQAFLNLFFNAVEAMPSGGSLHVTTDLISDQGAGQLREGTSPGRLIRIRIRDTGTGIDPEKLNRIFEPFFTTKPHGTGLGLAVTHRVVQEHKGTIHAQSAPDHGTTFIVLLPVNTP